VGPYILRDQSPPIAKKMRLDPRHRYSVAVPKEVPPDVVNHPVDSTSGAGSARRRRNSHRDISPGPYTPSVSCKIYE